MAAQDDRLRHPHGDALLKPERGERVRADDPVGRQLQPALEGADAAKRRAVEVRVHGDAVALLHEQVLEHGDVPAEGAAAKSPVAEERPAERAHRGARARVREPGRRAARAARWNVFTAATVCGPTIASIAPR